MFKRLEAWFRRIVAEEVAKLKSEKSVVTSAISVHTKAAMNELEGEIKRLLSEFEAKLKQL